MANNYLNQVVQIFFTVKIISPAHKLVKIGPPAIPYLINFLEDKRFTRTIGYWRNFVFSHYVLRIGDCALQIIENISGQNFYVQKYTNASMIKDSEENSIKKVIANWWDKNKELLLKEKK